MVKPEGVGRLHVVYKDEVMELPVTVIDGHVPDLLVNQTQIELVGIISS